jgi:hypothetical protein
MANESELLINIVKRNKPKMLIGLTKMVSSQDISFNSGDTQITDYR